MTVRVVVTAASRHGATHEIATAIAAGLARRGVEAVARPAEEVEKAVVVAVRAPEGDFRDWDAIDAFAATIAARLLGT